MKDQRFHHRQQLADRRQLCLLHWQAASFTFYGIVWMRIQLQHREMPRELTEKRCQLRRRRRRRCYWRRAASGPPPRAGHRFCASPGLTAPHMLHSPSGPHWQCNPSGEARAYICREQRHWPRSRCFPGLQRMACCESGPLRRAAATSTGCSIQWTGIAGR